MADSEWSGIEGDAAGIYHDLLVPAIFEQWVPRMLAAGGVGPGDRVLDVACGTGVVAREAVSQVGPDGMVCGLDLTEAMLDVARRLEPAVEWRQGDAMNLPFDPASFDVVLCQAGLMFVPDRVEAVSEMRRVLGPSGRLAVQVFAASEGQDAFAEVIERHAGSAVADRYLAPWSLRDPDELLAIVRDAGFENPHLSVEPGWTLFPSIDAFLRAETGTLIAGLVDADGLAADAAEVLAEYCTSDGALKMPGPGHIVTATKT